jgi:outer membrane protein
MRIRRDHFMCLASVSLLPASRLLVGTLLIFVSVSSGQNTPLTLADCRRLAESVPSNVTIARLDAQIARAGINVARAGFLPQLGVVPAYTYNSPHAGEGSFVALNGVREYQAFAATTLEIDTSGRLRAALARAHADRDIADINVTLVRRDLRRAVATAYYRVLLARRLVEAAEGSLMEATSFRQRAQALLAGGEVARADVVKADSQVAFLQQTVTAAELEAQLANQELASFWTADVNTRLSLQDTLTAPAPPEQPPPGQAPPWLRRPELNLLEAEKRGFEADYRRERAAFFPQLGLVYQYGLDAPALNWNERGSAFFVTMSFPIFDWFRIRNTARQFTLRSEQTDANRVVATRAFSREYETALARLRLMWQQIATTDLQVKTSEENLKLARVRYEGGEGPALDVVVAQQQLQQARTNYFTLRAEYANARADLEVARGQ